MIYDLITRFFESPKEEITDFYVWRHGETDSNHLGLLSGAGADTAVAHLNLKGQQQAAALAQKVLKVCPDLQIIYSSDLQRSLKTAQAVQTALKINIQLVPQLREIFHGEYELTPASQRNEKADQLREREIKIVIEDRLHFWKIHPMTGKKVEDDAPIRNIAQEIAAGEKEPETVYEMYQRVHAELIEIAKENLDKKIRKIGISSHGGVISTVIDALIHKNENLFFPPFYMTKKFEREGQLLMPAPSKIDNCDLVHLRYHHNSNQLEYCGLVQ